MPQLIIQVLNQKSSQNFHNQEAKVQERCKFLK
jgi:hypothetical protein